LADKDYTLHDLLGYMTNTKMTDDPRNQLMDFAHLLEDMGEYAKAEQLYRHLQVQYKGDTRAQAACHYGLGVTAQRMGHYPEAIEHGHRCIELELENGLLTPPQLIELAKAYNNLGMEKGANGELKEALKCLHMSNDIKLHVYKDPEHELMADTYANIGNCYFELGQLNLAEQNLARSVAIRKKYQTLARHPDFIQALMSLGNIYGERNQYERAISQHKEALDLASETLPYYHPLLGMCYLNLAGDYKDSRQWTKAKDNYLQVITIYKYTMNDQHPEMQRAVAHLREVERQL
jgi:tetratricopeptide (TPR) repeat protein